MTFSDAITVNQLQSGQVTFFANKIANFRKLTIEQHYTYRIIIISRRMYKQNYEANGRTDTEPFLESTRGERFYQREEKNRAIFQVLQPVFVVFP